MAQPAPGQRFGAYWIVRQIGAGGMGTVWEGQHEALQKRVAIKTLNAASALSQEAVARFMREGQSASKIEHPHIAARLEFAVQCALRRTFASTHPQDIDAQTGSLPGISMPPSRCRSSAQRPCP